MFPNGGRRFIQACLNGGRTQTYHPEVLVSADEIAGDAVCAVAAELHTHPRNEAGRESLWAVDDTVRSRHRFRSVRRPNGEVGGGSRVRKCNRMARCVPLAVNFA